MQRKLTTTDNKNDNQLNKQQIGDLIKQFKSTTKSTIFKDPCKSFVKPPMGSGRKTTTDFTQITRTGRPICFKKKEMPDELKRLMPIGITPDLLNNNKKQQQTNGISNRIKDRIIDSIRLKNAYNKSKFNRKISTASKWTINEESDENDGDENNNLNSDNEEQVRLIKF